MPDEDDANQEFVQQPFRMSRMCPVCLTADGIIHTVSGQDTVRCARCQRHIYNASRLETGRKQRSLSTRRGLNAKQRFRILERFGHTCVSCHATGVPLQIAHLISRDDAAKHGFLDEIIDSDVNLAPMCAECNSGQRPFGSVSIQLMYRALLIQQRKEQTDSGEERQPGDAA